MADWLTRQWRRLQASDRVAKSPAMLQNPTTVRTDFRDATRTPVDPFEGFTVTDVTPDPPAPEDERDERGRPAPGRGPFFEVERPRLRPGAGFRLPGFRPIYGPSSTSTTFIATPPAERPPDMMMERQPDPIFDARQNVIEACKHLAQVEEHLFRPDRRCADCVDKHLRLAESYSDELLSLDPRNLWAEESRKIALTTRGALRMLEAGAPPEEVARAIRPTRKACLAATRSFQLERGSHVRAFLTKRNLAIAAAAVGALWLARR